MIPDAAIWTVVIGLAAATYLIRISFLGLLAGRRVPPGVERALALVPVTVLPALIVPMVFAPGEGGETDPAKVAASAAALVLGAATRNVLAAMAGGIAGYALTALAL